jgi:DNA-directed RNA polymerase specialized sigma24 family protein
MKGVRASNFPTTSWSLVLAAGANPTPDSRLSLATLCKVYWTPIYAFIRRNGYDRDQAQDLTQAFFAAMLEKNYLGDADRERGRFRTFLLTAVKHFLANEWDKAHALKRGGGQVAVPIDPLEAEAWYAPEAVEPRTPESLFERRWALSVLGQVMGRLQLEFNAKGKAEYFDKLSTLLNGDPAADGYETMAAKLGTSPGALRVAVHRMRRRYRDLLRAEIAETVSTPAEIDDEIRFLLSALRV